MSFYKTCVESRHKYNGVSMVSKENDLDLFTKGYPYHLTKLNTIEELIILKVFIVMWVYWLSDGNQLGYKGHCLNIEQNLDIQSCICNILPRLPTELPYLVIRKRGVDVNNYKDFKVNIWNVCIWLLFLKTNHPEYRSIEVNNDQIQSYAVDLNCVGDICIGNMLCTVEDVDDVEVEVND